MKKSILFLLVMGLCVSNVFAQYEGTGEGEDPHTSFGESMTGDKGHEDGAYRQAPPAHAVFLSDAYELKNPTGLDEGEYKQLGDNKEISCIEVKEGFVAVVYEKVGFEGASKEFRGPATVSLKGDKLDNKIASIRIKKATGENERRMN